MTDSLPRPQWCQRPSGGCKVPPVVVVTYQTAPIAGRPATPGGTFVEAYCRADLKDRIVAIHQAGGRVLCEEELPPLPEPTGPEPIGLDAIDPTVREV